MSFLVPPRLDPNALTALRSLAAAGPSAPLDAVGVIAAAALEQAGLVRCVSRTPPGGCRPEVYAELTDEGRTLLAAQVG